MAELAIPALAFGALYICSNKDKKDKDSNNQSGKEGYENINNANPSGYPSNTPLVPPRNYPKTASVNPIANPKAYPNSNASTDKYFTEQNFKNSAANNSATQQQVLSMTGQIMDYKNFEHNNMVPFFGGSIRGRTADANSNESILDNMQGQGKLMNRKEERAPLFAPQNNIQWTHGAPNANEFYRSRENPSANMSNVKPWQEVHVGPGLNKGYGTTGSGGFNSGMESRNDWLPKTVNELRVATNPKETYGLANHQGPAMSSVVNRGIEGKVEKHLPDTFYINNPDRWLTTTGLEKGETQRPEQIDRETRRMTTGCEYTGGATAHGNLASYSKKQYQDPKRTCLPTNPISNMSATNQVPATQTDYGNGSYDILANNRGTTDESSFLGVVSGTVNAIVSPILDVLRPTKKENVIGNLRMLGDAGSTVPSSYIINPADRAPTTIKETTEQSSGNLVLTGTQSGGYLSAEHQAVLNQRDTTNCQHINGVSGSATGIAGASHLASYNQTVNENKSNSLATHPNQGGMQLYNPSMNICDPKNSVHANNRDMIPTGQSMIPSTSTMGCIDMPEMPKQQSLTRMEPNILDAFKKNPYTQSLHSVA